MSTSSSQDLIDAKSSQNTHIKIEMRQLAQARIRAKPKSARAFKIRTQYRD